MTQDFLQCNRDFPVLNLFMLQEIEILRSMKRTKEKFAMGLCKNSLDTSSLKHLCVKREATCEFSLHRFLILMIVYSRDMNEVTRENKKLVRYATVLLIFLATQEIPVVASERTSDEEKSLNSAMIRLSKICTVISSPTT